MVPSTAADPDRANWPHAVIVYNAGDGFDITPYPSYDAALAALRDRAAWWDQEDTTPCVDVTTASVSTLSDLYANGDPDAWVALQILEKPIVGEHSTWRIHLAWPD